MKPSEHQDEPSEDPEPDCGCAERVELERPRGRLSHAWAVLRGRELTNTQLQAEWLEYKQIFGDILTRLSAQLARQAKVERKRIVKQLELDVVPAAAQPPAGPARDKSELRRRAAAARGISFPHQNGGNP